MKNEKKTVIIMTFMSYVMIDSYATFGGNDLYGIIRFMIDS